MGVPSKVKHEEPVEDWLTTYADAITLLMCFFVMMLTFAQFDIPAYEEAAAAIKDKIGSKDEPSPTEKMKIDLEDVVFQMQVDRDVRVSKDSKGVVIELASNSFYKPGTAELADAAIPVLDKIAQTISAPRYATYNIQVEGHTDDEPIHTEKFPSNWELSTARAATVVRFFIDKGYIDPIKLSAAGFADQKPKVPNRDAEGKPIPENMATNRRTAIRVTAMSLKEKDEWFAHLEAKRIKEEEAKRAKAAAEAAKKGEAPPAGAPADGTPAAPQDQGALPAPEGQAPAPRQ